MAANPRLTLRPYVSVSVLALAAYFLLPTAAQNLAFLTSNLVSMAAILMTVRRRCLQPRAGWLLLAAFPALTAVGNAIYFVNDSIRHVQPFPSVGDSAFLGGYLLLALGLLRLQHARSARRDLPAVLDAAIITIGFAVTSWVVLVAPLLHDPASTLLERLTALGYPVADVLVLAVASRFLIAARWRGPAFGWLAGTVLVMFVADTTFAVLNLLGSYHTGHPVDALILAYNLGWGAVTLHSGAAGLTSPAPKALRPSWWRLGALTSASLIAPIVLVWQVLTGHLSDVVVTAGAAALLFLLVVIRMAGLVRALESVLLQRRALETELAYRAHHDDLTGLANRRMFTEQLQQALDDRPAGGTRVLYLDLDRFKTVNDSLGHAAGDCLLTVTASRLRAALQPADTVARLGGDEFAVLLADDAAGRSLQAVSDALTAATATPVPLHGLDLHVTASIGAAQSRSGDSLEDLLQRADSAMYAHKTRTDRRANGAPPGGSVASVTSAGT